MNQTKLGVSTGLIGFIGYILGGYSSLWVVLLLMFYVLTYEPDRNLRVNVVQATLLSALFSAAYFFLSGISGILNVSILGSLNLYSGLYNILEIVELIVFFIAALKALQGEVAVFPIATDMVKKHFAESNEA